MSDTVKHHQHRLNVWTKRWLNGITPLIEDGDNGPATKKRIHEVRYYVGSLSRSQAWSSDLAWRLDHPRKTKKGVATPKDVARGIRRRIAQRARWRKEQFHATVAPGVTRFDGVPCAIWLAKKLQEARNAGRWKGRLVSGWRSPSYSQSLCFRMCGAPSCPGRCAGVSSNHSGTYYPRGAVDVSDYVTFGAECRRLGLGIHNSLGAQDPVHFSVAGN